MPPAAAHSRQIEPPAATSAAWTGHSHILRAWLGTTQYLRYRLAGVAPHSVSGDTTALHGHIRAIRRSAVARPISMSATSHLAEEADSGRASTGRSLKAVTDGRRSRRGQEECCDGVGSCA